MLALIARRLLMALLTLWLVSVFAFVGTQVLPGDVAQAVLGQFATDDAVKTIREALHLDRPAYERYWVWFVGVLHGDLGRSLATGTGDNADLQMKVSTIIGDRLRNTALLAVATAAVAVPLALLLGITSALYPGTLLDRAVTVVALCGISMPEFLVAAILVLVFTVELQILPAIAHVSEGQSGWTLVRALALPVLTLTWAVLAHMTRLTRLAILSVMSSAYVEMALLKGLSRRRIVLYHALPNALSPIINVVALNLAYLVSGVVVVETVYAYPGLGKLMVDAVTTRDIPMVQACALIFCLTYVGLNAVADLLAITANPRLRHPR